MDGHRPSRSSLPPSIVPQFSLIAEPTAPRLPALTIQCDASVGVPKLVCGHTSIVPIIFF